MRGSGFIHSVVELLALLGMLLSVDLYPVTEVSGHPVISSWIAWPFNMVPTGCPKKLVTTH